MENNQNIGQMSNSEFNVLMFTELSRVRQDQNQLRQELTSRIDILDTRQVELQRANNNTNAHLNDVDARLTLTEQNLNLLKDRVNNIAERAVRNNELIFLTNSSIYLKSLK